MANLTWEDVLQRAGGLIRVLPHFVQLGNTWYDINYRIFRARLWQRILRDEALRTSAVLDVAAIRDALSSGWELPDSLPDEELRASDRRKWLKAIDRWLAANEAPHDKRMVRWASSTRLGEPPIPLWATISTADVDRRTGASSTPDARAYEDAEALDEATKALADDLRDVVRLLLGRSPSAAAKELGISRRKLRAAIAAIRQQFERAGLGD